MTFDKLTRRHSGLWPHRRPPPPSPGLEAQTVAGERVSDPLSGLLQAAVAQRPVEPGAVRQPTIQRNKESAELLTKLAEPQVFVAPESKLQTSIVERLEDAIAAEGERVTKANKELPVEGGKQAIARDIAELFVGGIELTSIPDDDSELLEAAKLIDLPKNDKVLSNALGNVSQAFDMAVSSGVAKDLVKNTLQTMIRARQIEYLRTSGLLNECRIVIEVHYLRSRPKTQWQMHKDTLGQTLFVNINYETEHEIAGPEYLLNPPAVDEHDRLISSMPKTFLEDLDVTRKQLGEHGKIMAPKIPAHGVVAFVDEAIHHMTPRYGGRTITGKELGTFLEEKYSAEFDKAEKAYAEYETKYWPIASYSGDTKKWLTWTSMVRDPARNQTRPSESHKNYSRKDLLSAGVTVDDVDTMLERFGGRGFQTVSIPKNTGALPSVKREGRPPLKRQMSELALGKQVPPEVSGNRRFFRTWVRAVPR